MSAVRFRNILFLPILLLWGCASQPTGGAARIPPAPLPQETPVAVEVKAQPDVKVVIPPEEPIETAEEQIVTGRVFAKTVFEGTVKAAYVKLTIHDKQDPQKFLELIVGKKDQDMVFPWDARTVQPGYFLLELPVGEYRVRKISIPVGSTQAEEPMDVTFEVLQDKMVYLGTLKVVGTSERIKLGGVPLLKPGFTYTAEMIDQGEEARLEFRSRYPDISQGMETRLMRVNLFSNAAR